jgi:hypothetical protein
MKNLEFRKYLEVQEVEPTEKNRPFINPITKKPWRTDQRLDQLAAIMKDQSQKGLDPNRIWVTFSEMPKLGIRPYVKSSKSTPFGVFGYPAKYLIKEIKVKNSDVTFSDRRYMIVFYFDGPHMEVSANNKAPESQSHSNWKYNTSLSNIPDSISQGSVNFIVKSSDGEIPQHLLYRITTHIERTFNNRKEEKITPEFIEKAFDNREILNKILYESYSNIDNILNWSNVFYKPNSENPTPILINFDPESHTVEFNPEFFDSKIFSALKQTKPKVKIKPGVRLHLLKALSILNADAKKPYVEKDLKILKMKSLPESVSRNLKKWKEDKLKQLKASSKNIENNPVNSSLKKLQPEISQYDINLEEILKRAYENITITTNQQALYFITKELAKEIGEKTNQKNWPLIWTRLLQKLGRQGIMDTKDTGTIHSSEPTQGVFLDPKYIHVITIIDNKKYDTGNQYFYKKNRQGEIKITWKSQNISSERRTIISVTKALEEVLQGIYYQTKLQNTQALTKILKITRTALSILDNNKYKGVSTDSPESTEISSEKKEVSRLELVLEKLKDSIIEVYKDSQDVHIDPVNQQILQQILALLNKESFPKTYYGPKASKLYKTSEEDDW